MFAVLRRMLPPARKVLTTQRNKLSLSRAALFHARGMCPIRQVRYRLLPDAGAYIGYPVRKQIPPFRTSIGCLLTIVALTAAACPARAAGAPLEEWHWRNPL